MNKVFNANVWRLAAAQALAGANTSVIYSTGAIAGARLAPSGLLSTLPISLFVCGMALATLPAGALAVRYGRQLVFVLGAFFGVMLGVIAAWALLHSSFFLFCAAMPFGGAYAAIVLTFRFAAAESVDSEYRARAISVVMAAGVLAGIVGPQLVIHTAAAIADHQFAATYLASAIVALLSAFVLRTVRLPSTPAGAVIEQGNIFKLLKRRNVILAITCGAVSYTLMNFLMTSAPLAMERCGLPLDSSSMGMQWHVIAMYGPGFFTGSLIARWGATRVVLSGLFLIALSAAAGMSGIAVHHFWLSLILLGAGWNLSFVGASFLLTQEPLGAMRPKVQAANDFIIFACVMLGSLMSGGVLNTYGWKAICFISLFPLGAAALFLMASGSLGRSKIRAME